jgi:hypothetical protein
MQVRRRPSRTALIAALAGLMLGSGATRARASEWPPPVLNPKTYKSASGQFALRVDPGDMLGRGGATYRLTKAGREVWSGKKAYTLWDAGVTDEGVVAGYAYSHGWRGFSKKGIAVGMGDFRAVILDARGVERMERVTERKEGGMHSPPNPLGEGMVLDAANDRMVIRLYDPDATRDGETWRTYCLSDGKPLAVLHPQESMLDVRPMDDLLDAKLVEGTPLILTHWLRQDLDEGPQGARFTLVGTDGKPVWTLELKDDYKTPDEHAQRLLMDSIRQTGTVLRGDKPGEFSIWFVKEAKRVTFSAKPDGKGAWTVAETGRRDEPRKVDPVAKPPSQALRSLGRIELKMPNEKAASPIRNVHDFEIDDKGRIAFLRVTTKAADLVVVDQQGVVLHTVPLDPAPGESDRSWFDLAWGGGDRYVVTRALPEGKQGIEAVLVDAATAKVTPMPGPGWTALSEIAGRPDGGFVIRGGLRIGPGGLVPPPLIVAYDAKGARCWSVEGDHDSNNPASLFSPKAMTVNAKGEMAVVDVIRHLIQWFDRDGKFLRAVDLQKAWGRKPNYPSGLAADRDGGLIVRDFLAKSPLVRIAADGKIRAEMRPRYADGRAMMIADFGVAPDGRIWVCNGFAIMRLADSGVVDQTLGDAPDADRLGKVGAVAIDRKGRIYAVDATTAAVHVFDAEGRWLRVAKADPKDFSDRLILPHLTVSDDGDIYLSARHSGDNGYLHFSPEAKRIGFEQLKLDDIREKWDFQPGTGHRMVLCYEAAFLVDRAGAVVRTIERGADDNWLVGPHAASFAPDGSFAILAVTSRNFRDGPVTINLYTAKGDPVRTITLPGPDRWSYPSFAYDGKRLAVVGDEVVLILNADGQVEGRFTLGAGATKGSFGTPFLDASGRQLMVFDHEKTIHRFALP